MKFENIMQFLLIGIIIFVTSCASVNRENNTLRNIIEKAQSVEIPISKSLTFKEEKELKIALSFYDLYTVKSNRKKAVELLKEYLKTNKTSISFKCWAYTLITFYFFEDFRPLNFIYSAKKMESYCKNFQELPVTTQVLLIIYYVRTSKSIPDYMKNKFDRQILEILKVN